MVAVVVNNNLGISQTSLNTLGLQTGTAAAGRSGEAVYVNAANGNLVVQRQDEILLGRGPDVGVLRTYNSQGQHSCLPLLWVLVHPLCVLFCCLGAQGSHLPVVGPHAILAVPMKAVTMHKCDITRCHISAAKPAGDTGIRIKLDLLVTRLGSSSSITCRHNCCRLIGNNLGVGLAGHCYQSCQSFAWPGQNESVEKAPVRDDHLV